MRKRLMMLMVAGVLGVGLPPAASADTYRVAQDDTAESEDDDGTDYGWIGLLGLAGLAGLMGRKRRDEVVHREPGSGRADVTRDR